MIEAATAAFKQNLDAFCQSTPVTRLTPEAAETVAAGLTQALGAAGVAGYRAFLKGFETSAPVVEVDGQRFRFKHVSLKEYLTPFGPMVLARRLYQNAGDTESHVPLDAAWGMKGHYMAPAVREAVLYACAHLTPEETAAVLGKCGLCHPQPTAIKHALEQVGAALREHKEALLGKGTPEARAWYERYATALLERDDGARRVQRSIRYYLTHGRLSKAARETVADELRYFSHNGSRMRYADFRRQGWPIGSGPVEAACKSVVKARLCRSGMRWSRAGGQRILDLRTYVKSQRWDAARNEIKRLPRAA